MRIAESLKVGPTARFRPVPHGGRMMSTLSWVTSRSIALTASSELERSSYSTTSIGSFLPPTVMPPAAFTSFTHSW